VAQGRRQTNLQVCIRRIQLVATASVAVAENVSGHDDRGIKDVSARCTHAAADGAPVSPDSLRTGLQ